MHSLRRMKRICNVKEVPDGDLFVVKRNPASDAGLCFVHNYGNLTAPLPRSREGCSIHKQLQL